MKYIPLFLFIFAGHLLFAEQQTVKLRVSDPRIYSATLPADLKSSFLEGFRKYYRALSVDDRSIIDQYEIEVSTPTHLGRNWKATDNSSLGVVYYSTGVVNQCPAFICFILVHDGDTIVGAFTDAWFLNTENKWRVMRFEDASFVVAVKNASQLN